MENLKNIFKKRNIKAGLILLLPVLLFAFSAHANSIREVTRHIEHVRPLSPPFQFAVIGDSRDGEEVYARFIRSIMRRKPDFIVHLGDMVPKPDIKEWRDFFDLSRPVTVPFFPVAGNHDVGSTHRGREIYQKEFRLPEGKTYYSFGAGKNLFVILDTEEGKGRIPVDQMKWLEEVLGPSDPSSKWVFLHRPLFLPADSFKKGRGMDRYPSERDQLHRLFVKSKVKGVFAGDDHRYHRREKDGVLYIISGGGGAPLHPFREWGGYFHYVWVLVQPDQIEGEVIDLEGQVRDRFVIR